MTDVSEGEPPRQNDGRKPGHWQTRYGLGAWLLAILELCYLLALLLISTASLAYLGVQLTTTPAAGVKGSIAITTLGITVPHQVIQWVCVGLSGVIGGITFDLKWLYHSFSKWIWNVDRVFWRILVPIISGIVSLFLGFLIVSGIIPFFKGESFHSTYFSMGFGFLFGYFSDNVLAAMFNTAQRWFGTTRDDKLGEGSNE